MDLVFRLTRALRNPVRALPLLCLLLLATGIASAQTTRDGRSCTVEAEKAAHQAVQRAGLAGDQIRVYDDSAWAQQQMQAPVNANPGNIGKAIARFSVMGQWSEDKNAIQPHAVAAFLWGHAKRLRADAALGLPVVHRATVADVVAGVEDDRKALSLFDQRMRDGRITVRFAGGSDPRAAFEGRGSYALEIGIAPVPGHRWDVQRHYFNRVCATPRAGQPVPPSFREGTCLPLPCDADFRPLEEALKRQAVNGGTVNQRLTCAPDSRTYPLEPWQVQQVEALRAGTLTLTPPALTLFEEVTTCPLQPPFDEAAAELAALPCKQTGTCERDKWVRIVRDTDGGRGFLNREVLATGLGPLMVMMKLWGAAAGLLALLLWLLARFIMHDTSAQPSNRVVLLTSLTALSVWMAVELLPYVLTLAMLLAYSASSSARDGGVGVAMALMYIGIGFSALVAFVGIGEGFRIVRGHKKRAFVMFWIGVFLLGPLFLEIAIRWNEATS